MTVFNVHMFTKIILTITLVLSTTLVAAAKPKPLRQGTLSTASIGARYSSLMSHRGVVTYDDFQVSPFLVLIFFDEKVEFLGDSLGFRDFIAGDYLRFRTRVHYVSDTPFLPRNENIEDKGTNREDTYEWANGFELFLPGYNKNYVAELSLMHYKDIKVHRGEFFEFQGKVKLFDFKTPFSKAKLEPNFVFTTGYGNRRHNSYAYGPGGEDTGRTYQSFGLWVAIPEVVDRYYPNVQLTYFETSSAQSDGALARGRDHGVLFSFIASVSVLDWWRK